MFVADGNFKADHLTPRNAADDVWLTAGEGFMTPEGPYQAHLKDATENASREKRVSLHMPAFMPLLSLGCFLGRPLMGRSGVTSAKLIRGICIGGTDCGYEKVLCRVSKQLRCPCRKDIWSIACPSSSPNQMVRQPWYDHPR